jgi:iron(II)-dependent oxidoreductase
MERGAAPFMVSQRWEPFYPMHIFGVFASRWSLEDQTIWTIVNRNEYDVLGQQMSMPFKQGMRYFDLYYGEELTPQHEGEKAILSFPMEARGYGMVLATPGAPSDAMRQLMSRMKEMTKTELSSLSHEWKTLPQQLVEIAPTPLASSEPKGMVKIPGGDFVFKVEGIEIEGSNDVGIDVQYPWEDAPRRFHEHPMQIKPFYMDKHPVTNTEFKEFLDATHYRPKDNQNFLKDWINGSYPAGWDKKPVTWVSLEDARAYAKWAGKRLRMNGSGNSPRKAPMAEFIRGVIPGMQAPCRSRIRAVRCGVLKMWMSILAEQAHLV